MAASVLAWTTLGISAASAIDSRNRAKRVERANNRQVGLEQARTSDQAARQRREQIRQARIAQGSITNQAVAQGVQGSSAPIAAAAGVQTSANLNIGEINNAQAFGAASSTIQQDIFNLQQPTNLQYAAQIAGAASSIFPVKQTTPAPVTTSQPTPRR